MLALCEPAGWWPRGGLGSRATWRRARRFDVAELPYEQVGAQISAVAFSHVRMCTCAREWVSI